MRVRFAKIFARFAACGSVALLAFASGAFASGVDFCEKEAELIRAEQRVPLKIRIQEQNFVVKDCDSLRKLSRDHIPGWIAKAEAEYQKGLANAGTLAADDVDACGKGMSAAKKNYEAATLALRDADTVLRGLLANLRSLHGYALREEDFLGRQMRQWLENYDNCLDWAASNPKVCQAKLGLIPPTCQCEQMNDTVLLQKYLKVDLPRSHEARTLLDNQLRYTAFEFLNVRRGKRGLPSLEAQIEKAERARIAAASARAKLNEFNSKAGAARSNATTCEELANGVRQRLETLKSEAQRATPATSPKSAPDPTDPSVSAPPASSGTAAPAVPQNAGSAFSDEEIDAECVATFGESACIADYKIKDTKFDASSRKTSWKGGAAPRANLGEPPSVEAIQRTLRETTAATGAQYSDREIAEWAQAIYDSHANGYIRTEDLLAKCYRESSCMRGQVGRHNDGSGSASGIYQFDLAAQNVNQLAQRNGISLAGMDPYTAVNNPKVATQLAAALFWENTNKGTLGSVPLSIHDPKTWISSFTTAPGYMPDGFNYQMVTATYTYGTNGAQLRNYNAAVALSELTDAERQKEPIVVQRAFYSQYTGLGTGDSFAIYKAGCFQDIYGKSLYSGVPVTANQLNACNMSSYYRATFP